MQLAFPFAMAAYALTLLACGGVAEPQNDTRAPDAAPDAAPECARRDPCEPFGHCPRSDCRD